MHHSRLLVIIKSSVSIYTISKEYIYIILFIKKSYLHVIMWVIINYLIMGNILKEDDCCVMIGMLF